MLKAHGTVAFVCGVAVDSMVRMPGVAKALGPIATNKLRNTVRHHRCGKGVPLLPIKKGGEVVGMRETRLIQRP